MINSAPNWLARLATISSCMIEEIGERFVETLRPEMTSSLGVDELGVDPNVVLVTLYRTF